VISPAEQEQFPRGNWGYRTLQFTTERKCWDNQILTPSPRYQITRNQHIFSKSSTAKHFYFHHLFIYCRSKKDGVKRSVSSASVSIIEKNFFCVIHLFLYFLLGQLIGGIFSPPLEAGLIFIAPSSYILLRLLCYVFPPHCWLNQ